LARGQMASIEPQSAKLSFEQMKRGIKRLQSRITDLENFDPQTAQKRWAPEVKALEAAIDETLVAVFGPNTLEYKRYRSAAKLDHGPMSVMPIQAPAHPNHNFRQYLVDGKRQAILLLKQAVRGLEEEIAHQSEPEAAPLAAAAAIHPQDRSKVFIVHGHDNEAKTEVALFLHRIDLEPIILHERPNLGRHLLTKFQEEAEGVGFAVVLITPDDEGALKDEPLRGRARQNVVFELGFLIGKLGPSRVAALVKGNVERPSDFDGVGYITLDPAGGWKGHLARELRAVGIPFDANKALDA